MDEPEEGIVLSPGPKVTMTWVPRDFPMYSVSGTELDTISSPGSSLHFGFFGLMFGAAVAIAITLLTVPIERPTVHAGFVASLIVTVALSLYFGLRALRDNKAARQRIKEIKTSRRGG